MIVDVDSYFGVFMNVDVDSYFIVFMIVEIDSYFGVFVSVDSYRIWKRFQKRYFKILVV